MTQPQRKRIVLIADHAARLEPLRQMMEQIGDALLGGELAEHHHQFDRAIVLALVGAFHAAEKAIAHRCANSLSRSFEPAHLHVGQCRNRELRLRIEDADHGEQVSRQQKAQNLPATVAEFDEAIGPAGAEDEDLRRCIVTGGDSFAGTSYL
jgi:hypothetical protein